MSIFSILFVFFSPFFVEIKDKKKRICKKFSVKKDKEEMQSEVCRFESITKQYELKRVVLNKKKM